MRIVISSLVIAFVLSVSALVQPAQRFDAISIRPNNSGVERSSAAFLPGGRFDATNKTFQWLLRVTFGVQDFQITGAPGWVGTDHFDLHAKADIPGKITSDLVASWAPDEATGSDLPWLFTALRGQLGLRLESRRGPVEFIVIDRIQKPSAN